MLTYKSMQELIDKAGEEGKDMSALILADQAEQMDRTAEELYNDMAVNFKVMMESIEGGLRTEKKSQSGLTGGAAFKMQRVIDAKQNIGGKVFSGVLARALAVAELNACIGRI